MSTPALQATDLHQHFRSPEGPVRAVDGVSFTVEPGEIVAFLGPNGAGKTTTIDMALGLASPTSGQISVLGRSPREAVEAGLVGAVMQTGGLLRDLTVAETVTSIAALQGRPERVETVLAEAQLTDLARRKVSRCSGGEQQRLKYALALLSEPQLVVLDEPTTGMDVGARRTFWESMRRQATQGRTILFATHYLEEAQDFAQRIILMSHGKVVADGTTPEIRSLTSGRTLEASFEGSGPLLEDPRIAGLLDGAEVLHHEANGRRLLVRTSAADDLARRVLDAGGHDLLITEPSLDDVFVSLTEEKSA